MPRTNRVTSRNVDSTTLRSPPQKHCSWPARGIRSWAVPNWDYIKECCFWLAGSTSHKYLYSVDGRLIYCQRHAWSGCQHRPRGWDSQKARTRTSMLRRGKLEGIPVHDLVSPLCSFCLTVVDGINWVEYSYTALTTGARLEWFRSFGGRWMARKPLELHWQECGEFRGGKFTLHYEKQVEERRRQLERFVV